jgi:hypothetical protein
MQAGKILSHLWFVGAAEEAAGDWLVIHAFAGRLKK